MRKSLVSIVALGLFAGAPAMAQTTTTDDATNQTQQQTQQQQSTQQQGTQQQTMGTQQTGTLSAEQFEEMLSEYEARDEVEARIVRAITPEGNHVLVLVGPRNFEPGESVEAEDTDVRERFEGGRFSDVVILGEPRIFRADLDEDHYIFALSADQILRFGVQTGGVTGDTTGGTGTEMGRDATVLSETDTDTTVEMGQTDTEMEMDPETGTETETQMGQTGSDTGTQTGQTGTQTGQTGTQTGQSGSDTGTQTGQTGTQTGQSGTSTGTQMGQTGTQTGQTGTGTETQMGQTGTQTGQTGTETGQIGRALSEPDADRIVSNLEEAGLENAREFEGRLVKATGENGAPVFFVITSKDMESDAEIDIDEDEVRQKLEEADLEDVQFIDNAQIVRGELENDHVFVLAGDLFGQGGEQQ